MDAEVAELERDNKELEGEVDALKTQLTEQARVRADEEAALSRQRLDTLTGQRRAREGADRVTPGRLVTTTLANLGSV